MWTPYLCYEPFQRKRSRTDIKAVVREVIEIVLWYEAIANVLEYILYPNWNGYVEGPGIRDFKSISHFVEYIIFLMHLVVSAPNGDSYLVDSLVLLFRYLHCRYQL